MKRVQRYTWEDSLIEAESLGLLPPGAVNVCLRLAKAINWEPKNSGPSELRWKNEDALKSVKSSRATYFRYREILFETGFLTESKGNLVPLVPDLSQIKTAESRTEATESHIETARSQIDNPCSEDTYSEDISSEDVLSTKTRGAVSASASPVTLSHEENKVKEDEVDVATRKILDSALPLKAKSYVRPNDEEKTLPQSQPETHGWDCRSGKDWHLIMKSRPLTEGEKTYREIKAAAYNRSRAKPKSERVEEW